MLLCEVNMVFIIDFWHAILFVYESCEALSMDLSPASWCLTDANHSFSPFLPAAITKVQTAASMRLHFYNCSSTKDRE